MADAVLTTGRRWWWTVWGAAVVFAVVFGALNLRRHREFGGQVFDLGIFDQGVWLMSEGHAPEVTVNARNLFADHLSPVLLLFVPLYVVAATPVWLIAGQAAAIAAALERFLHDTAPVLTAPRAAASPWGRAAIAEGVGLEAPTPWGDPEPWGTR